MPVKYKYKCTDYELQKLNLIDNNHIRLSLMSILAYMKLYNKNRNSEYELHGLDMLKKDVNQLKISFENLHDAYTTYLKKHGDKKYILSLQTLKNRIDKLIELKLLTIISKVKKTNVYSFISENISENMSNNENITPTENTCIETESDCPKYINSKSNTYTYTLNTTNVVHALDLVSDVFKSFKVKSKEIKTMVIDKLKNTILDAAGAVNYIVKVITEKTEEYNSMRVKYAQKVAETKYNKYKNTFVIPVKASNRTFYNCESREYDYDMLEDKLVYGGYNGEALLIRK